MNLEKQYIAHNCCDEIVLSDNENNNLHSFSEELNRIIRDFYKNKGMPDELIDQKAVKKLFAILWNGIQKGYDNDLNIDFETPDYKVIENIKKNLWEFSIAKNHNDLVAINNQLIDEQGNLRSWNDFKRAVEPITGRSIRYLKTEYRTARTSATMVKKWQELQENKRLIPYAKFLVVTDKHTTDICKPLDNVVVPIDDPILKHYFPPNHWNCRTNVVGTRYDKPTPKDKIKLPIIPDKFKTNVGITGRVFNKEHSYTAQLINAIGRNNLEHLKHELATKDTFYITRHTTEKGGKLRENIHTDKVDYLANLHIGKLITELEKDAIVDMLPHSYAFGVKNPELKVRHITGDITNRQGSVKNFVGNSFKFKLKENGQLFGLNETFLALNFKQVLNLSNKQYKAIVHDVYYRMKHYKTVKHIYIIYNDTIIKIDRDLSFQEIRNLLKPLKP